MPAAFDNMVSKIWAGMLGKKNPKTGKPFTKSDAYAVATSQWKKSNGGKLPTASSFKDWHVLEFFVPIKETSMMGNDFFIKGVAINETTTRNGVKYIANELEKAAPSFRNKPILLDHDNSVKSIVGRTTNNVNFNSVKRAIEFEAKIMDKQIQEMINDGRITDVSIGAKVQDLVQNKDEEAVTAIGVEGLEISLVAVPGDPGANLAMAMFESLQIKSEIINDEEDEEIDYKELVDEAQNDIKVESKLIRRPKKVVEIERIIIKPIFN